MILSELLRGVEITGVTLPGGDARISSTGIPERLRVLGIATDCNRVRPGDVFICISGERTDGHLYAAEAVKRGAAAVIAERELLLPVPVVIVKNTRAADAFMWNNRYSNPAKDMNIIAVTGTNGKTSVCFMTRAILSAAGIRCGIIGTVKCMAGDEELSFGGGSEIAGAAAAMTTPDPEYLYGCLYEMRLRGVTHVIMEASSHALAQHKLDPLPADIAVFTGLSPEHLDFHGTMENYLSAKSMLFRGAGQCIINIDDEYAGELLTISGLDSGEYISVGTSPSADFSAADVKYLPGGISYRLHHGAESAEIHCPMPGKPGFVDSMLAAAAAFTAGVPLKSAKSALDAFPGVPGRMETIGRLGGLRVIRDFAHTPEAMRCVIEAVRTEMGGGRLWVLFGCGGDRDRTKRPVMGKIAADMADYTVITSDNCRTENRDAIISDIMSGFDPAKPHAVIPDRREAIRYAVLSAGDTDTVLLCGKGHENYEITSDGIRPFDEVAITESAINERRGAGICDNKFRKGKRRFGEDM